MKYIDTYTNSSNKNDAMYVRSVLLMTFISEADFTKVLRIYNIFIFLIGERIKGNTDIFKQ
jgi:hypothetical protein